MRQLREALVPLGEKRPSWGCVLPELAQASAVLLGEATHGTAEFYACRAEITKRLIAEHGFRAVVVEADWPDAYRINRFVRGLGADGSARAALDGFLRFPRWMWRNVVMVELVQWLADYNRGLPREQRAGVYGMDLYSMYASLRAVIEYLDEVDPEAAQRARMRYPCLGQYDGDPQRYGYLASLGVDPDCTNAVTEPLRELREGVVPVPRSDGLDETDERLSAEQNARVVQNAERYYRAMYEGGINTWNLRDQHMVQTIADLRAYLERRGAPSKLVVWAHNSHLGDARATDRAAAGEVNVGQLMRAELGEQVLSIGFTTHHGTVAAASRWGGPVEYKRVRPSASGSVERIFHQTGVDRFVVRLGARAPACLDEPRLQRAIGVLYLPATERSSHYLVARLARQFDAVIHVDETRALEPLEPPSRPPVETEPETYPFGV